jgi:hypothetical protein
MDFVGTIISGLVGLAIFMGIVYIGLHNPSEVTVITVTATVGTVLLLVKG